MTTTQQIIDDRNQYMTINYGRYPIAMSHGQGCNLTDADGKQYLDLFAGFGAPALGHCHPDLVKAVTDQASKLWHVGNLLHTEPQTRAARQISTKGFGGRCFFCHCGAGANEAAIKLTRLYGKANPDKSTTPNSRYKVISATQSFHGRSFATMCATAQPTVRQGFEPHLPGYTSVSYNDLDAIKNEIDEETVAILVEPIQGEGGVNMPDDDYLPSLRTLCDENDLLLIFDEVWTGGGRTGKYFGHQHWTATPDIMTLGKGVGGGLAVGVMCANEKAAEYFDWQKQGGVKHATTLGGNCLSMAVTAAIFEIIERDNLLQHATEMGNYIIKRMQEFAKDCPAVKGVRGKGLFIGIELDGDTPGTWFDNAGQVVSKALDQGLIINAAQNRVLRLAPPMVITKDEIDRGLDQLQAIIKG